MARLPSRSCASATSDFAARASQTPSCSRCATCAKRSANGSIPTLTEVQQLDDETVIERLTEVRGIGRWTVEMLLMFRLARPDVLPVDDYGVRQGFALAYRKRKPPSPKALAKYGARWAPYRTVASWYLWRAVDLARRGD